jgi:D-3-phosphoglycerate dehydrogenase
MFRIRIYNNIRTQLDQDQFIGGDESQITDPDLILVRSEKLHDKVLLDSLLAIARAGAGVDNIPIEDCTKRGIVVFNTPGANANSVKELVVWAVIESARHLTPAVQWLNTQDKVEFNAFKKNLEAQKKHFAGVEIKGKNVFVLGLGYIGSLVAQTLASLEMNVWGYDPFLTAKQAISLPKNMKIVDKIEDGIKKADFVTLHVNLTPETRNLLNKELLQWVKSGVSVINFARSELVDQKILVEMLSSKQISAYISDFISPEFLNQVVPNAIFLPHLGAQTKESEENCSVMAVNQSCDFLENGNVINSVNFPNCQMDKLTVNRLVIINENVTGMLARITGLLSQKKINIAGMINASKNDYAYNIFDLDQEITSDLLETIKSNIGIVRVRKIG